MRLRTVRIIGVVLCIVGTAMWAYTPVDAHHTTTKDSTTLSLATLRLGTTGEGVTELQTQLVSFGYVMPVDGIYGPITERAVRHFQRASGLLVDGVAGPLTRSAIEIAAPGVATGRAVRGESERVAPEPAAPAPTPASSTYTGPCAEWASTMEFFGLPPEAFGPIMHRESRCRPDVTSSTGCCHGLLQIHRIHLPKPECRAYSEADLFDPAINICVASVLYKRSGMAPWRLG